MALILREDDVRAVLTMPDTVTVLDAMFRRQGQGDTRNVPRTRVVLPDARGVLHVLSGYVPGQPGHPEREGPGLVGLKDYTGVAGVVRFLAQLFSAEDGRLLALIEADLLGQMRTGAASGVATRYMAREDARVVALLGTGGQAHTQALAMCAVRPIETLLIYGRDEARRQQFCEALASEINADVRPVASAEEAVRAADIVVTATTAREPVMSGAWLRPGVHLNVMGSNWAHRREVDAETVRRSSVIAVDSLEQARVEAGDLLLAQRESAFGWDQAVELGAIVAGQVAGRPDAQAITLFKSLGIAIEDVATAGLVYMRARERGLGHDVELLG